MLDLRDGVDLSDAEIIQKTLAMDKDWYGLIVQRYEVQIRAYVARILNFQQEDAQDVASTTFIKAYLNLNGYNQKLKFSSWLYRIAHNEAVNLIKKKSKIYNIPLEKVTLSTQIDWDKPTTEDLEIILDKLKITDKNILILFYLQEKTIKEISEILKISEGSVKTRLNRARNRARKITSIQNHKYA